jgi:hypothetical protein
MTLKRVLTKDNEDGTRQLSSHLGYSRRYKIDYVIHASSRSQIMSISTQPQPPAQDDWIRVTSRDGFSFIVKRNVVFRSGTLRNMLDERRMPLIPCSATLPSCSHDLPYPDSFTEAVQKVCPVDERCLSFLQVILILPS